MIILFHSFPKTNIFKCKQSKIDMQNQEIDEIFDFEKYPYYLVVEVKFNAAGTTIDNQVNNFIEKFQEEQKDKPGFNKENIYTAIASACGNDHTHLDEFDLLMYIVDDLDKVIIDDTDRTSVLEKIKGQCTGKYRFSDSEISGFSKSLENIFKDVISEIMHSPKHNLNSYMSKITMNYNVYGDIRAPEADIIVGFMNKESFERFYNVLGSKEYLYICHQKKS